MPNVRANRTPAAGRLGPGWENVPRTPGRAKLACRSGSGVQRWVMPHSECSRRRAKLERRSSPGSASKLVPQKFAKTDTNESPLLLRYSLNKRQLSWMLAKQTHLSFNN